MKLLHVFKYYKGVKDKEFYLNIWKNIQLFCKNNQLDAEYYFRTEIMKMKSKSSEISNFIQTINSELVKEWLKVTKHIKNTKRQANTILSDSLTIKLEKIALKCLRDWVEITSKDEWHNQVVKYNKDNHEFNESRLNIWIDMFMAYKRMREKIIDDLLLIRCDDQSNIQTFLNNQPQLISDPSDRFRSLFIERLNTFNKLNNHNLAA